VTRVRAPRPVSRHVTWLWVACATVAGFSIGLLLGAGEGGPRSRSPSPRASSRTVDTPSHGVARVSFDGAPDDGGEADGTACGSARSFGAAGARSLGTRGRRGLARPRPTRAGRRRCFPVAAGTPDQSDSSGFRLTRVAAPVGQARGPAGHPGARLHRRLDDPRPVARASGLRLQARRDARRASSYEVQGGPSSAAYRRWAAAARLLRLRDDDRLAVIVGLKEPGRKPGRRGAARSGRQVRHASLEPAKRPRGHTPGRCPPPRLAGCGRGRRPQIASRFTVLPPPT
jgi:hypothetical protein